MASYVFQLTGIRDEDFEHERSLRKTIEFPYLPADCDVVEVIPGFSFYVFSRFTSLVDPAQTRISLVPNNCSWHDDLIEKLLKDGWVWDTDYIEELGEPD